MNKLLTFGAQNCPGLIWVPSRHLSSSYPGPPHTGTPTAGSVPPHRPQGLTSFRQEAFSTITWSIFRVSALLALLICLTLAQYYNAHYCFFFIPKPQYLHFFSLLTGFSNQQVFQFIYNWASTLTLLLF